MSHIRVDSEVYAKILEMAHVLEQEQGRRVTMGEATREAIVRSPDGGSMGLSSLKPSGLHGALARSQAVPCSERDTI